jgi:hypothetical protein
VDESVTLFSEALFCVYSKVSCFLWEELFCNVLVGVSVCVGVPALAVHACAVCACLGDGMPSAVMPA